MAVGSTISKFSSSAAVLVMNMHWIIAALTNNMAWNGTNQECLFSGKNLPQTSTGLQCFFMVVGGAVVKVSLL
jgi:hypothetical protein